MMVMKKRMLLGAGGIAALSVLVAACGGNNNNNLGPTYCGNPARLVLIYPAPGATSVPVGTNAVYVAAPQSLGPSTTYDLAVLGPGGSGSNTNTFSSVSASAVPSPAASPGFANPHYYVSAPIGFPLSPATEYAVYFNDTANFCTPNVVLGNFTTQ
jgi:hypothetical protein